MKNIIGLTGPTGSGKSTFCTVAEKYGFFIIDCDKISREVTEEGSECLNKLARNFGEEIIEDGKLNRARLAQIAFSSDEKKQLLEDTIFPFILDSVMQKISQCQNENIILDAPTLYESGIDEMCGSVIAVLCSEETRIKRIINRDKLTKEQAILRIKAGKPDSFYEERADYIVNNYDTEDQFINQCNEIIKELKEE